MPHYPLPIPPIVIEAIDGKDKAFFGAPWITRRAENRAAIQKLSGVINTIYESGAPFFTKDAIRDLVRQIDEAGVRRVQTEPVSLRFSVTGIDGKTADIPVKLGVKHGGAQGVELDGVELFGAILKIEFRTIDHLTSIAANHADEFDPDKAFLSMAVEVETVPVLLLTGEAVPPYPINRAPETRAILHGQRTKWNASNAYRQLVKAMLADAGSLPRVDKVVAFACFNPSDVEAAEKSATEHALVIISLRDFFARQQHQPTTSVRCYAQDPLYQDVDREVLGELGMTVLDHPRGFLEVDDATAVFSQSPTAPVRQVIADIARPALMIWNRICEIPREGSWVGVTEQSDNISPRLEEMIRNHYIELPFPADLAGFGSLLAIYVRKY
ncbi:hypothetical protein C8A01DRAFT_40756 [Parachaetomium inaequale]|uniref:SRR1-like domain-containing protein n=1 Tax=Parachaetomium inaequale TaxID=2588326 RepID=A0AAN6P8J6_9PEZI|nr:hypothetical protein C8A01DRAFT_40756 [Parachaetomium inaequale]